MDADICGMKVADFATEQPIITDHTEPSERSAASTIWVLLAEGHDDADAIVALDWPVLTYSGLRTHVEQTVTVLNRLGIRWDDRVAIVLPSCPEMATAFVSITAGATAAPLNPAYRLEEFGFSLSDLGVKALLVEQNGSSPAVEAAIAHNIPILEAVVNENALAGLFEITHSQGISLEGSAPLKLAPKTISSLRLKPTPCPALSTPLARKAAYFSLNRKPIDFQYLAT